MERSTIIASVVAGAGILIAGSVAGTAAVNAAASSESDPSTSQLLAAPAVVTDPASAAVDSAAAILPPFTTEALPSITVPSGSSAPSPGAAADAVGSPERTRKPKPTTLADGSSEAPATSAGAAAEAVAAVALPPEQAVALVLAATGGGATQDVRQASRAGYDAWAVTVQRPDGSVVTGFVDRATATIFDWRVVQEAPKPAPVTAAYQGGEYEEEDEHENEHEEEYENEEHEGDEDDD